MEDRTEHRQAELDVIEAAEQMVMLLDEHQAMQHAGRAMRKISSARLDACRQQMKAAVKRMYRAD